MPTPPSEKLTRREREIMNVLFALGNRASAEEIRLRLTDPPSSSAVPGGAGVATHGAMVVPRLTSTAAGRAARPAACSRDASGLTMRVYAGSGSISW